MQDLPSSLQHTGSLAAALVNYTVESPEEISLSVLGLRGSMQDLPSSLQH